MAEFFGEGVELAELFLLGGGFDGEGLALVVGGAICDESEDGVSQRTGSVKAPG